jgi:polyvinyl alcohol dehydrogenase (cytochrome)
MGLDWLRKGSVSRALKSSFGVLLGLFAVTPLMADDWPLFGGNLQNTATTADNSISVTNVGQLHTKWVFNTGGDVSARAAVVNGVVYFPDWAGNLYAINAGDRSLVWQHQLSDYGLTGSFNGIYHSRTTPAVVDGTLYIGTQEGAWLLAIDAATGVGIWQTQMEPLDPYAIVSSSPVVYKGVVYTGVASIAEGASAYGINLANTTPRGSAIAVAASNGRVLWQTHMAPVGYRGVGVWGSNPVVDKARNSLYVSTGNNYTHPDDSAPSSNPKKTYGQCIKANGTAASCSSPDNHVDSIVALDMDTGAVKWARKLVTWNQGPYVANGSDDWNVDCLFFPSTDPHQCPSNAGPDYDFGSAPNLITYKTGPGPSFKTIIGAGQKSGIYYALDPGTGAVLWQTQVGPGSALGGMEWGSASDGKRIYVQIANLYGIGAPGHNAGSWSALDPATGQILWQTQDPNGAIDIGPMTVANGVVYAASMAGDQADQTMFALNAATGQIVWSFAAGSSVNAGATVANGVVYWGSGYTHLQFPGQTGNTKFYAFSTN